MHLTDPLRPVLASGHPALLIDGSAVPRLSVLPVDDLRTELVVMLRAPEAAHGYTYSQHRCLCDTAAIGALLQAYFLDPEAALEAMFGWKPQELFSQAPAPVRRRAMSDEATADLAAQLDLI